MKLYSWAVLAFSVAFVGIGIALLAATAAQGGGVVGFLLGGLFVALWCWMLWLGRRIDRDRAAWAKAEATSRPPGQAPGVVESA